MILQSSKLLLLYNSNRFITALYGQPFLFWPKLQRFPYMGGVFFLGDLVQILTLFCFSIICSEYFFRQPVALSGDFVPLKWFSQTRSLAFLILLNKFPNSLSAQKGKLFHLSCFQCQASFIHISKSLMYIVGYGNERNWMKAPLMVGFSIFGHSVSDKI